jgi:hypothetical protein
MSIFTDFLHNIVSTCDIDCHPRGQGHLFQPVTNVFRIGLFSCTILGEDAFNLPVD